MAEGAFPTRGEVLSRELGRRVPNLKTFVTNPTMPEDLLTAIGNQTSQCKQIYVAAFITVSANRGSVNLEGGLSAFLKALVSGPVPVALISFGNPYLWRDFPDVSAYAAMFSTAVTSESAAAKAILGEIAITGKMPVSIPGLAKTGDGLDVPAKPGTTSNDSE
jgi:beta-N-acetylhexosaminidase